jgi:hypothetical protein
MRLCPPIACIHARSQVSDLRYMIAGSESQTYWKTHTPTSPPCVTHMRNDTQQHVSLTGGGWSPALTRHLYGKQCRDGRVIFGGDRRVHPVQHPDLAHCLPRQITDMTAGPRAHSIEVMPSLAAKPIERVWSGIMSFSRDGQPQIGRIVDAEGEAYVISGLNGSGFMVRTDRLTDGWMDGCTHAVVGRSLGGGW